MIKEIDKDNLINLNQLINSFPDTQELLIISKDRVKNLGEVYTAKKEINSMIDLIPTEIWEKIDSTF